MDRYINNYIHSFLLPLLSGTIDPKANLQLFEVGLVRQCKNFVLRSLSIQGNNRLFVDIDAPFIPLENSAAASYQSINSVGDQALVFCANDTVYTTIQSQAPNIPNTLGFMMNRAPAPDGVVRFYVRVDAGQFIASQVQVELEGMLGV